jgi:hypothetical protein
VTGAKTPDDAKWRDFEERLDGDGANRTPPVGAFTARSETGMVVSEALEIYGRGFKSPQLHTMFINTNLGPLRRLVLYFSQTVPSLSLSILMFDL